MDTKTVIKFYATWCGPCTVYAKTWDEVTSKLGEDYEIHNVDIDKDTSGLAAKYKVMSVPTTVVVNQSGEVKKEVGRLTSQQLTQLIQS